MSDEIIRSNQPHKVTLAEGSLVAKGHTASEGDVTIHRTLAAEKSTIQEEIKAPERFSGAPDEIKSAKTKIDIPAAMQKVALLSAQLGKTITPQVLASSDVRAIKAQDPTANVDQEDMNFPARLIHLKIENDKVRKLIEQDE